MSIQPEGQHASSPSPAPETPEVADTVNTHDTVRTDNRDGKVEPKANNEAPPTVAAPISAPQETTTTTTQQDASTSNIVSELSTTPHKSSSKHSKATTTSMAAKTPRKKSLWSILFAKLIPCVPSSKSSSTIVDDSPMQGRDSSSTSSAPVKPEPKSPPLPQKDDTTPTTILSEKPVSSAPTRSSSHQVPTLSVATKDEELVPPTPVKADIVVPPSPKNHLLPESETAGVTSGAVQPPGSTGNEHDDEVVSTPTSDEEGGEHTSDVAAQEEDDEDRLILQGGNGIPIVDGIARPLLPPPLPEHKGRKCLVLDLDETLLHSSFKMIPQCDYVVPVEIEWQWHNVYVIKRPGVDAFLQKMAISGLAQLLQQYADPVLDKLDVHKVVTHRLFRESCYNHRGNYVKDLSQLGRPIAETIILDNSPASYIFHPNNAVPVSSWFNDPHDTELTDLCPFLADLRIVDDVRGVLDGGL